MSFLRNALLGLAAVGMFTFAAAVKAEIPKTIMVGTEATFPPL